MFPRYVDFTVTNDWRCSRKLTSFSVPLQASVSIVRVIGSLVPNDLETNKTLFALFTQSYIKGVKKVCSAITTCSHYFSYNVSNDTGIV